MNNTTKDAEASESVSAHVLCRDLPFDMMPLHSNKVQAVVSNDFPPEVIANALGNDAESLYDAVTHFFIQTAQRLIYEQETVYEVLTTVIPKESGGYWRNQITYGPTRSIKLSWLPKDRIERRSGRLYVHERDSSGGISPREIPRDRYVVMSCPKPGGSDLMQICREISHIEKQSSDLVMSYFKNTLGGTAEKGPDASFDYEEHLRNKDRSLLYVTKDLGWNYNGLLHISTTNYYLVLRILRCKQFMCRLRDAILQAINAGIHLAGAEFGFSSELQLIGLPSLQDIHKAMERLEQGSSFAEVLDPLKY